MPKNNWTKEELIVAFNLYCKTPFTKIGSRNKGIQELAPIIGRSVSAVALKLANFARLDPALKEKNISGMKHGSKGEEEVWKEFNNSWEELAWHSEQILANFKNDSIESSTEIKKHDLPKDGKERERIVKTRVNQSFFRKTILASYDNKCCITEISNPELLIASHIIPWSLDKNNRMNPSNGLCLNALHDKAFDRGLITITPNYSIKLSIELLKSNNKEQLSFFLPYMDKPIALPQKFYPSKEFLEYHNKEIFRR